MGAPTFDEKLEDPDPYWLLLRGLCSGELQAQYAAALVALHLRQEEVSALDCRQYDFLVVLHFPMYLRMWPHGLQWTVPRVRRAQYGPHTSSSSCGRSKPHKA